MRMTSGTRSRTSKILGRRLLFWTRNVTTSPPSSNMRALDSFRMARLLPNAMPSSASPFLGSSTARCNICVVPKERSPCQEHEDNHGDRDELDWLRSVKPSKYMATARLPSIADFLTPHV